MLAMRTAPYAAFLLRISLGILFFAHGATKLLVFAPAGTAAFFASLGLPPAVAYLTILAELGGAALLIGGVLTRWAALALVPLMLGTIIFDHGAHGWIFSNPGGGWEYPAFWTVTLLVQALLGDGAFALPVPFLRMRQAHAI
jgi:putative oxidoreductase